MVAQLVMQVDDTAGWDDTTDEVGASDVKVVKTESIFIGLFC